MVMAAATSRYIIFQVGVVLLADQQESAGGLSHRSERFSITP